MVILVLLFASFLNLVIGQQQVKFLSPEPFRAYVSSSSSPDTRVYQIQAVSLNNGTLTYNIQTADPSNPNLFAIDTATGIITNTAFYSSPSIEYNVIINVSSSGLDQISANLTVTVLPSFQTNPRFEHSTYVINIIENVAYSTPIIAVQAFSLVSANTRMYTIVSGNVNGSFTVNSNTGFISTNGPLDRETVTQYLLTVRYIDDVGSVDAQVQVIINDVNDNPPSFNNSFYQFSIDETSIYNTLVGTVMANDPDYGSNAVISYALSGEHANRFTISNTGQLHTQSNLNYEETTQYSLVVRAQDSGIPSLNSTAVVLIDINNVDDECPIFSGSMYVQDIPYDFLSPPLVGDHVLSAKANDPDNAGEVTYSLISGNVGNVFSIDSSSGNITLARNDDSIRGQYVLIVSASDANCINMSLVQVEIGIGSANVYSPSFTDSSCTATLVENPPNGTVVVTLLATDQDFGINGLVTYDIVNNIGDFTLFAVDSSTGRVTTTSSSSNYDRESKSGFQLGVTATDGGYRQDFCILQIVLLDENDNAPVFDVARYETVMTSDPALGSTVIQVQAQDSDFGSNGDIVYSLSSTSESCPFDIDGTTGFITVNETTLTINYCLLTAIATDQGINPRSTNVTVNITITHGGDVPVFNQDSYNVTIPEGYSSNSLVLTVSAMYSGQGLVAYSFKPGSDYRTNFDNNFMIIPFSGEIHTDLENPPDYEKLYPGPYSFRLLVEANAVNADTFSVVVVTIHITDINDNFPSFSEQHNIPPTVTYSVVENQSPGPIGIVQATDEDFGSNGVIYYRLVNSGDVQNKFAVSENGTISSLVEFDAEGNVNEYQVIIGAYNEGHEDKEAIVYVDIIIEDINDNPPTFNQSVYSIQLNETHLLHDRVLKITANDPDRNDQAYLLFEILSGNNEATFQLESSAGNGLLFLRRRLDYETTTGYSLLVQVSDGVHTDTATVIVDVLNIDDEPPMFSQSVYYTSVVENAPIGTTILTIEATDQDSSYIQFELKGLAEGRFIINSNGTVTVAGVIDREEFLPSEQIVFLVFAYGGFLSSADIIVNVSDVNDYTPKFIFAPFYGTAPENTDPGQNGLYVATVKAVDLDKGENGSITYDLISGQQDGFHIDTVSGIVIANRTFDREETRFFTLVVEATDNGIPVQLSSTVEIVVEISDANDNHPYWPYPYMYARVYENAPVGKLVIQLPAADPDNGINSTIHFTLSSGNDQGKFNLTSTTGEITVADSLNYEDPTERQHFLYFTIQDIGIPPLSNNEVGELEIHVLDANDHPPQFIVPHVNVDVAENAPIGFIVATISATDNDDGTNSQLNFTITDGDPVGVFSLQTHSNNSLSLIISANLDRETTPDYILIITATDGGYPTLSGTITVNVTLTDVNDEPPAFITNHFTVSVPEDISTIPQSIIYTEANDPDSDDIPGGNIQIYELVSSDDDNNQFIYNNNGWLSVVKTLDRETKSEYHFTVRAIDDDTVSPLTSTATITVTVTDVNDNPSSDGGQLEVVIHSLDGLFLAQQIGQVYFIDPDDNDTFTGCVIVSGDSHLFSVSADTCTLSSTESTLPHGVSYTLVVQGNDGIHGSVTTSVSIIVHNITVVPPTSALVSMTFNCSASQYVDTIRNQLQNKFGTLLSVPSSQIIVFSSQNGFHDSTRTVDVMMAVMETDSSYRNVTSLIQHIYLGRDQLQFSDILLYSIPVDPCLSEPCYNLGECQPLLTIQPFTSLSSKWYILFTPYVQLTYRCSCAIGTSGEHCQINFDDCYSNPCQYGGTCTDGIQDYYCECPQGSYGKDCSVNPDECNSDPCQNGATCANGFGYPICNCPTGYYGDFCQYAYFQPSPHCDSTPCQNNATCSTGRDSFTCLCETRYTGLLCQTTAQHQGGCVNNPCYNGSTCTDTNTGYTCTCSVGFTGPQCRFPLNNCELEYCRNGGTCERGLYGSYNCLCPVGYSGTHCTEILSLCHSSPCLNGGNCTGDTTSYSCECPREFYGNNCEYYVNPPNLCNSDPCNGSAICSPGQGNYTCLCTDGRGGTHCSESAGSPPLCDSNPCLHGGVCTNHISFISCQCPLGFTGSNCQTNIDECSPNPCLNNGTCIDGFGSYICTCVEGFTGRDCSIICPVGHHGEKCEIDKNYCMSSSCHNGGTCIEQFDGYSCLCSPQFTGSTCSVSNNCSVNVCTNGGTCVNNINTGYQCQCNTGYNGPHCELTTISFTVATSYSAYDMIAFRSVGMIMFDFATQSKEGLLLLNTQYQERNSIDFIAVEISGGYLTVKYSLGGPIFTELNVLSSSVNVADGKWHTVRLQITGKVIDMLCFI